MRAFFTLGLFAITSQVFLLKELSGLLTAHEISIGLGLAAWLFWTAAGMRLARDTKAVNAILEGQRGQIAVYTILGILTALNFLLIKRIGLELRPGLSPGLMEMIVLSGLVTLPAGAANGFCIFQGLKEKAVAFYWAEAAGAAAGGLLTLCHALFFPGLDPIIITGALGTTLMLSLSKEKAGLAAKAAAITAMIAAFTAAGYSSPPFAIPGSFAKAYRFARSSGAKIAVMKTGDIRIVVEDGAVAAQFPSPEANEARAQIPMLAHSRPENILILGAAGLVLAPDILGHNPKNVTLAEADRFKYDLYFDILKTPDKVLKLSEDGRYLLRHSSAAYDVIFQTTAEPVNAAANRYFTREFFRDAKKSLKPGGILAFTLPFSENYLSPQRSYFAAVILHTLKTEFSYQTFIPGQTLIVLASDSPLNISAEALTKRYRTRHISGSLVTPDTIPFLLDPYRAQWALTMLEKVRRPSPNTDMDPIAYFHLWKLWMAMFVSPAALTGVALTFILAVIMMYIMLFSPGAPLRERTAAGMFLIGAWSMAFELICLLLLQTYTGQLNWRMGLMFAAFMAGAAIGARMSLAASDRRVWAAIGALVITAALYAFLPVFQDLSLNGNFTLLLIFVLGGGYICGEYFSAAAAEGNSGDIYAAELLGAAFGGFILASILAPLAGMANSLILTGGAAGICIVLALWPQTPIRKKN